LVPRLAGAAGRRALSSLVACPSLVLAAVLASAEASASVPACLEPNGQPARERGVTLEQARAGFVTNPSPEEAARLRLPTSTRVTGPSLSFWDLVPPDFFLEVGRSRDEIEGFGTFEWSVFRNFAMEVRRRDRAIAPADRVQLRTRATSPELWRSADRLFAIAMTRRSMTEPEYVEAELGDVFLGVRFPDDPTPLPTLETRDARKVNAWAEVAGMYFNERLDPEGKSFRNPTDLPRSRYWRLFPKPETLWSLEAERRHLREYLCSQPDTKAAILRAEQTIARVPSSREATVAQAELERRNAAIAAQLGEFDGVFEALRPSSTERSSFLELVHGTLERARVQWILDVEGAAKSYAALRSRLVQRMNESFGDSLREGRWGDLLTAEQFLWNQPCLDSFLEEPWMRRERERRAGGEACTEAPLDRNQLFERLRPR
jgi:hypothetical protein